MKKQIELQYKVLLLATMLAVILSFFIALTTIKQVIEFKYFEIIALIIAFGALAIGIYPIFMQKYLVPISHTVAIVGFPESGKTTLLISLFGDIFVGKILPIDKITLKGTETIERINESLEKLKKGRALGPTKDQDRFAFRADLTIKRLLFYRTYKLEFGDFPGDESQEYSEKYGSWLHKTEFFKWVVDSDAMIFVIDLGRYIVRDKSRIAYVAQISSALRAAWQHFLDINEYRIKEVRQHPLVLVFTKADLFGVTTDHLTWDLIEQEIARLGFGDKIPQVNEIDPVALDQGKKQVKEDFADLIDYFKIEAPNFHIEFTSSFGLLDGERLGFKDLLIDLLSTT
jgi:GTPase SAR1 family protein